MCWCCTRRAIYILWRAADVDVAADITTAPYTPKLVALFYVTFDKVSLAITPAGVPSPFPTEHIVRRNAPPPTKTPQLHQSRLEYSARGLFALHRRLHITTSTPMEYELRRDGKHTDPTKNRGLRGNKEERGAPSAKTWPERSSSLFNTQLLYVNDQQVLCEVPPSLSFFSSSMPHPIASFLEEL